ncbi:Reverse transcriptase zinc-binding domain [Sesbania bispinosa]|nr:Reverse transcriptase zinc-binding domain [Sesbania bispinosa]
MNATSPPGASIVWRSIVKAKDALQNGFYMKLGNGNTSVWYEDWTGLGKLCWKVPFVHISDTQLTVKDLWEGATWSLESMATSLPSDIALRILETPIPQHHSDAMDSWCWLEASSGNYSATFQNSLPIKETLFHRSIIQDPTCPRCSNGVETLSHCFRDCAQVKQNISWEVEMVTRKILCMHHEDSINSLTDFVPIGSTLWWYPPPPNVTKLNVDGSYVARTGLMGIGGLLRDSFGTWLWGFTGSVGQGRILLAELSSKRLRFSLGKRTQKFHIQHMLKKDWQIQCCHVMREANCSADRLAKMHNSGVEGVSVWVDPPLELTHDLALDLSS